MTPTPHAAETARTPLTRDEVKRMLLDAAFVLHLTRRVKAEMIAERPEMAKKTGSTPRELTTGLGV